MQKLINQDAVLENEWTLLEEAPEALPSGKVIVSSQYFSEHRVQLLERGEVAVYLEPDADIESLDQDLPSFPLIAIQFPAFTDGRGYSLARLLKERYQYQGELRAIGDVLIDQLHYMKRCGFDTYLLKEGLDGEKALAYFATFSDPYQLAYDKKEPLFRRKP